MKNNPLVSIIITTKNEQRNIENCLESIKSQTYKNIEIIVVDNKSTDETKKIAKKYTQKVYDKGPERSAQRNLGAKKSQGSYLLFLDADMLLTIDVVTDCVEKVKSLSQKNYDKFGAIIVPEVSFGNTFWAQIKAYERSFYIGDDLIEAARFYSKEAFNAVGGFNENITGPEDWELSEHVRNRYSIYRIKSPIRHNEGDLKLVPLLKKKYYYYKKTPQYISSSTKNGKSLISLAGVQKFVFFLRPGFRKEWKRLLRNPGKSLAMCTLLFLESVASLMGVISGMRKGER